MLKAAHFATNWKRLSGDKRAYRVILSEQMKLEWSRWKTQQEAKKNWQLRQQLRDESNISLPLRSTPTDYRRPFFGGSRYVSAVGA